MHVEPNEQLKFNCFPINKSYWFVVNKHKELNIDCKLKVLAENIIRAHEQDY